jgi:transmembrane sensor
MATDFPRPDDRLPPGWLLRNETKQLVLAELTSRRARRRHRTRRLVTAGAVLTALVLLGSVVWEPRIPRLKGSPTVAVTSPLRSALPDGSIIEHKQGAAFTVDYSHEIRRVVLTRGTAHFDVTKDPARPFVVTASGVSVRAVGTAFSIECAENALEILVTEGRVAVASASRPESEMPTTVAAGEGVRVELAPEASNKSPKVQSMSAKAFEEKLAWRVKLVEFSGTPLRDAVQILNQHNRMRFSIADEALADLKLSGVIRPDRISGVVSFLEGEGVEVEQLSDSEIVLRRTRGKE